MQCALLGHCALSSRIHAIKISYHFDMVGSGVKRLETKSGASKGNIVACVAVAAFMAMMLARPDYYLASARKGLALYATSVLPSLFPFYFCSLLLTNMGAARTISTMFGKPISKLYGTPKESAYVLLLSMLSGYPVGASMTAELYGAGVFSQDEAKAVAAFASTSGPIFMLGTVGSVIFKDMRVGTIILVSHYVAALINGLIFSMRRRKGRRRAATSNTSAQSSCVAQSFSIQTSNDDSLKKVSPSPKSDVECDNMLLNTISKATLSMLYVGGYIVLCGMIVDTLPLLKADVLLESALGADAGRAVLSLLYGSIEMTRGCLMSAEVASLPLAVALSAGAVSLGGLSVTLQSYTFLSRTGMKAGEILLRKLSHALIAAAFAALTALLL